LVKQLLISCRLWKVKERFKRFAFVALLAVLCKKSCYIGVMPHKKLGNSMRKGFKIRCFIIADIALDQQLQRL